ncbi:MAG TPA: arylsulfotransferase family protein [Mycobacteriales bacterium]|jgi:hypothetical protein|nr:arylsulfotransferase family protein [Mycobacteriales bacterium]
MTLSSPVRRVSFTLVGVLTVACAVACSGSDSPSGQGGAGLLGPTTPPHLINSIAADSGSVTVFPEPGSRTALPASQITFRGINPNRINNVVVRGSVSGRHSGEVEADSDGRGGSFLPTTPFTPGERVTVHTTLAIRGVRRGVFSFWVAQPAQETNPITHPKKKAKAKTLPPAPSSHFASAPGLHPPVITVTKDLPSADHQDVALATKHGGLPGQLLILNDRGVPVWDRAMADGTGANDLHVQRYDGKPVLTYWQGFTQGSHGYGLGVAEILNSHYQVVATVHAGNGAMVDLHEFQLTPQGTAFVTAYESIRWNLTPVGGKPNSIVLDPVIQEIDVKTGLVEFEWNSLDHIPLNASVVPPPQNTTRAWDYVHLNSVDFGANRTLLFSARNTSALYDVDETTGDVLWTLGGKKSSFSLGPGAAFHFQHDARWHGPNVISLFDDGGGPPRVEPESRGLVLQVDQADRTASVAQSDTHTPPLISGSQGNMQGLPNGDYMVGWGDQAAATEFNAAGVEVWNAAFPATVTSYRFFRISWTGIPLTKPAIAVTQRNGHQAVAVSWNGDTRTQRWQLLTGPSVSQLHPIRTVKRSGFETHLRLRRPSGVVEVQSLSATGQVLGTSRPTQF